MIAQLPPSGDSEKKNHWDAGSTNLQLSGELFRVFLQFRGNTLIAFCFSKRFKIKKRTKGIAVAWEKYVASEKNPSTSSCNLQPPQKKTFAPLLITKHSPKRLHPRRPPKTRPVGLETESAWVVLAHRHGRASSHNDLRKGTLKNTEMQEKSISLNFGWVFFSRIFFWVL